MLSFTACSSVKNAGSKLKKPKLNTGDCPAQSERTLSDAFCKEAE